MVAWGPGTDATNYIGAPYTVWFDPQTRWRVTVEGDGAHFELTKYLPISALLGNDPVELAVFPKPVLGASSDELRTDYPEMFDHQSKEELNAGYRKPRPPPSRSVPTSNSRTPASTSPR